MYIASDISDLRGLCPDVHGAFGNGCDGQQGVNSHRPREHRTIHDVETFMNSSVRIKNLMKRVSILSL